MMDIKKQAVEYVGTISNLRFIRLILDNRIFIKYNFTWKRYYL